MEVTYKRNPPQRVKISPLIAFLSKLVQNPKVGLSKNFHEIFTKIMISYNFNKITKGSVKITTMYKFYF